MKIFKARKWGYLFLMMACSFFTFNVLSAGITSDAKHDLNKYLEKAPWLGLIADEVTYGPITVSRVHIHEGDKFVIAAPGESLNGSLRYRIDTDDLKALQRYHLVIGIKGKEAQECVAHSLGVWDSKGKANFTLVAPQKPGIYQVRFLFVDDWTCASAKNEWNSGKNVPSSNATIGVIIVE